MGAEDDKPIVHPPTPDFYLRTARARSYVKERTKFMLPMLLTLEVREECDEAIVPTAATTSLGDLVLGSRLANLPAPLLASTLAHEVMHQLLDHVGGLYARMGCVTKYERTVANIAMDFTINAILKNAGYTFSTFRDEGRKPPPWLTLDDTTWVFHTDYDLPDGLTVEAYFQLLLSKHVEVYEDGVCVTPGMEGQKLEDALKDEQGQGRGDGGGEREESEGGEGDEGDGKPNLGGQSPGPRKLRFSTRSTNLPQQGVRRRSPAELRNARQRCAEAYKNRGDGSLDGALDEWADMLLKPKIDYRRFVRYAVRQGLAWCAGQRYTTYTRRSKRQQNGSKVVTPVLHDFRPPVAVILDVSGSMLGKGGDLEACLVEVNGILTQMRAQVRVLAVDTELQTDIKLTDIQSLKGKLTGGGGTDLSPAFDLLSMEHFQGLAICFTDGMCGLPSTQPAYRSIFITTEVAPPYDWCDTVIKLPAGDKQQPQPADDEGD